MTSTTHAEGLTRLSDIPIPDEGPLTPQQGVEAFRRAVGGGAEWYPALLEVISRWVAPDEEVDGVRLHYLIAGEAFDWLLLAQRILNAATDLVRSEEHTSELQSLMRISYAVLCLKKKKITHK